MSSCAIVPKKIYTTVYEYSREIIDPEFFNDLRWKSFTIELFSVPSTYIKDWILTIKTNKLTTFDLERINDMNFNEVEIGYMTDERVWIPVTTFTKKDFFEMLRGRVVDDVSFKIRQHHTDIVRIEKNVVELKSDIPKLEIMVSEENETMEKYRKELFSVINKRQERETERRKLKQILKDHINSTQPVIDELNRLKKDEDAMNSYIDSLPKSKRNDPFLLRFAPSVDLETKRRFVKTFNSAIKERKRLEKMIDELNEDISGLWQLENDIRGTSGKYSDMVTIGGSSDDIAEYKRKVAEIKNKYWMPSIRYEELDKLTNPAATPNRTSLKQKITQLGYSESSLANLQKKFDDIFYSERGLIFRLKFESNLHENKYLSLEEALEILYE